MMNRETKNKIVSRVAVLIGKAYYDDSVEMVNQLVDDAEEYILAYTNRTEIPKQLVKTVGDLAILAYNRLGNEGESSRSEGGESYSFDDAPKHIYSVLNKFRLARCGGHAFEFKKDTAVSP